MIVIILNWIYIFISTYVFGNLMMKFLRFEIYNYHPIRTHLLGLFGITLFGSIFAFISSINIFFYSVCWIVTILHLFLYKRSFKFHIKQLILKFENFDLLTKSSFIVLFIVALILSALTPKFPDNETYYIQTIKWLNEYGFIKGLANLNILFAQNSGWHITQASLNFPFVTNLLNDLNGFLFITYIFQALSDISKYKIGKVKSHLIMGTSLIFVPIYFQFISAPSPDLILFTFTIYCITIYSRLTRNFNFDEFKFLISISLFLCFVKISIGIILILPLILMYKNFDFQKLKRSIFIGFLTLLLFSGKNIVLSGYPLYPFDFLKLTNIDWMLPDPIYEIFKPNRKYLVNTNVYPNNISEWHTFKSWLLEGKLHFLFNWFHLIMLFIFPIVLVKNKHLLNHYLIYLIVLIQFTFLWFSSPLYRFFLPFSIVLFCYFIVEFIKTKTLWIVIVLSIFIGVVSIFTNINNNSTFVKRMSLAKNNIELKTILIPHLNSNYVAVYSKEKVANFIYYSPMDSLNFWTTGDGKLPCVNKKQIDYILEYYHYAPSLRSNNIKDGFKSIKMDSMLFGSFLKTKTNSQ